MPRAADPRARPDATARLWSAARYRGVLERYRGPVWLPAREARAVLADAGTWLRRGLPQAALDRLAAQVRAREPACIDDAAIAELTLCTRCHGDGEWSPLA